MYLCHPRVFVNMKLFEELSDAELSRLWNTIVKHVNKIKITDKDVEAITDFGYGIDRIAPVVDRALDEMGVKVNYIDDDYDPFGYNDKVYYTFVESFFEPAVLVFIERVKKAFM